MAGPVLQLLGCQLQGIGPDRAVVTGAGRRVVDLPGDVGELGRQFEELLGEDLRESRVFISHGLLSDPVNNHRSVRGGCGSWVADGLKCPQSMDKKPKVMPLDGGQQAGLDLAEVFVADHDWREWP